MPADSTRRLRTLAALVLIGVMSPARAGFAQQIVIAPNLHAEDTFRLELTRAWEESSYPHRRPTSTMAVDVTVVAASANGITVDWIPADGMFAIAMSAPLLPWHTTPLGLEGLRLRLGLTAEGKFAGLLNEAEVMPKLTAARDLTVEGVTKDAPADKRKAFDALVAQMLSPAALLNAATADAKIYFSLNGIAIALGEAVVVDIDQPNPLDGSAVPSRIRIKAETVTSDAVTLSTKTTYDSLAFAHILRAFLEKAAGQPVSARELAEIPLPEMTEDGHFVLDRATGLMREVSVRRHLKILRTNRTDSWDFRLVQAPKR